MPSTLERPALGAYTTVRPWHGLESTWMRYGACSVGLSNDEKRQFFADTTRGVGAAMAVLEAKRRCWVCPVSPECLSFAIAGRMQGVWGGTTEQERNVMIRRLAEETA